MKASYLQKHLNILDYALSSLLRRRMKNLGILVIFSVVIFLIGSFQLITSSLSNISREILTVAPDITIQKMLAGRQVPIHISETEKLKKIFGISLISPRVWGYYFDESNGANYTVLGVNQDELYADNGLEKALGAGRMMAKGARGEVVIGTPVRDSMKLGTRSFFSLFRPDLSMTSFHVVGEFNAGTAIMTDDLLVMSREDAHDLFGMEPGEVTDLLVTVGNPREIETIGAKISEILPAARVLTRRQIQNTYDGVFGWRSGLGSVCLLTSLVAFVILAWDKASGLSPEEKREMGILKMVGWETSDILLLRLWESWVISFLSFLIGYTLGWIHMIWFDGFLLKPVLLGWSVLQPSYSLVPSLLLEDLLLIFTCSVIPYLAATIIPAWRSAIVKPDSVM
jgi:ABC-type lipoprotein release transport system permease subunit